MSRCPSCGSVFTLYSDASGVVWCSNCCSFSTTRIYESDFEPDETDMEIPEKEVELVGSK